jgi:hypothetical protein
MFDNITKKFGSWLEQADEAVKGVRGAAGDAVKTVTDAAGNTVKAVTDVAGSTVKVVTDAAGNTVKTVTDAAGNTVKTVTDVAGNTVKTVTDVAGGTAQTTFAKASTFSITMLGPSGVGKTSLLTSMYEQFERTIAATELSLMPDDKSETLLQERLEGLKKLATAPAVEAGVGVGNSGEVRSLTFGIGKKDEPASLHLQFTDFPGGFLAAGVSPEQRDRAYDLVSQSYVTMVVIDTPALMEANQRWNDRINNPLRIGNIFQEAYQDLKHPRLVLFVPVKCEKYVQDDVLARQMIEKIKEEYHVTFNLFAAEVLRDFVTVAVAPVQTVGTVVFDSLEVRDNIPHFLFRRTSAPNTYHPRDTDQPLRYIMRFLLKLHYEERVQSWWVLSFLREWLEFDEHLKKAVSMFAQECKEAHGGFEIIQGQEWLKFSEEER